jgi:hypothetical protein
MCKNSFLLPLSKPVRDRGQGAPCRCLWWPRRRRLERLGARAPREKGRGRRGDQALVLTGGGEERGRPEFELRRRRSSGLQLSPAAAASVQGQGDGAGAGLGRHAQQGLRLPL